MRAVKILFVQEFVHRRIVFFASKALADFFSHRVKSHTFCTTDVTLPFVIGPRAEYQQTSGSTRIEEFIRRLVVITETIVSKDNEGLLFL